MSNSRSSVFQDELDRAAEAYLRFIGDMRISKTEFRFTPHSEATPFSLCFALFGLHLLGDEKTLQCDTQTYANALRDRLYKYYSQRKTGGDIKVDKPFLQLLAFTLSALSIMGCLRDNPLEEIVLPLLTRDVKTDLDRIGALDGIAGSGNLAMFMAILLIHARDYLGLDTNRLIEQWIGLHLDSMNRFGFWGESKSMTHLQFQNGYHQYEIFDYLNVDNSMASIAAESVAGLADDKGHFAPYPGGGGCYDYDAIFVLTSAGEMTVNHYRSLLERTMTTIISEQNPNGGFAESHYIRPRSLHNFAMGIRHALAVNGKTRFERLRQVIVLQRPKHNRIHTHWSRYSREWSESDLWDSWFRMLTVARIEVALNPSAVDRWGFINYPGIGYYRANL